MSDSFAIGQQLHWQNNNLVRVVVFRGLVDPDNAAVDFGLNHWWYILVKGYRLYSFYMASINRRRHYTFIRTREAMLPKGGIRYPGYPYWESSMYFSGAPFSEVALVATTGAKFAIDNIVVRDTSQLFSTAALAVSEPDTLGTPQLAALAAPEPGSLSFMLAGLTILFFIRRWSTAGRG